MKRSTFAALTGAAAGMLATRSFPAEAAGSPAPPHGVQSVAMVVYPGMTALDLIAPQLIFATLGNTDVQLVWKARKTVVSDTGVPIVPTQTFDEVRDVNSDVARVPNSLMRLPIGREFKPLSQSRPSVPLQAGARRVHKKRASRASMNYPRCSEVLRWRDGLSEVNKYTTRDAIGAERDVRF